MTDLFAQPDDATPLDPDDQAGLLRTDIVFRWELNNAEAANVAQAQEWAYSQGFTPQNLLTQRAMQALRRRMFDRVWSWAG